MTIESDICKPPIHQFEVLSKLCLHNTGTKEATSTILKFVGMTLQPPTRLSIEPLVNLWYHNIYQQLQMTRQEIEKYP